MSWKLEVKDGKDGWGPIGCTVSAKQLTSWAGLLFFASRHPFCCISGVFEWYVSAQAFLLPFPCHSPHPRLPFVSLTCPTTADSPSCYFWLPFRGFPARVSDPLHCSIGPVFGRIHALLLS
jgi:hypothetical protein